MVSKKKIYRSNHPFDVNSFEALSCSSWKPLESIRIINGVMTMNFVDKECTFYEKVPFTNVRVKSRQATQIDCTCFLRPGVDVCVLSENETKDPVWLDGRISSVARKPHESGCSCEFYINFYTSQAGLGSMRESLSKDITAVSIDRICILQRLGLTYCEDKYYRWNASEDSSTRQKTKMLLGRFLTDMTWLIVASSVKKSPFDVKSVQSKLVYQILQGVGPSNPSGSVDDLYSVNFRVDKENGVLAPVVFKIVPEESLVEDQVNDDAIEDEPSPVSNTLGLRRSIRRNVQPERFLGCDSGSEIDIGYVRTRPYKFGRYQDDDDDDDADDDDDEMNMPLSSLFGVDRVFSERNSKAGKNGTSFKRKSSESTEIGETRSSKKLKSGETKRREQDIIVPFAENNDPLSCEYYRVKTRNPKECVKDLDEIIPQYYSYPNYGGGSKTHNGNDFDLDEFELETKWSARPFVKRTAPKKKYRYPRFNNSGERTYQKRSLHAGAYTELINSFLRNIDCNSKEEPDISEQWKESTKRNEPDPSAKAEVPQEEEEEMSETEMLWQEFELALASLYVLDGNEGFDGVSRGSGKVPAENCKHEFVVDDELGILCDICGDVITGIRDMTAPFVQNTIWYTSKKSNDDFDRGPDRAANMDYTRQGAPDEPLSEDKENVWALIPEIKKKLHLHQRKAFEFLWQNIAGTLRPEAMDSVSKKKTGGCVISHTPGAGKTFLIIAFLVSYLKLFPGKRPLILAPKTTLYTWYKEFIKWKIPVPVYLIHGRRTYRVFKQKSVDLPGGPKPTDDVRHILDCLEKIQKWHSQPSVLVMGYTSFLSLMREDSKFEHRKFMAKVLRESPGLLVLDEGHNPRSTKSRLRKALMKVETDLRILLSGTVFQNNFCEYFNTLCLARPKFVNDVLRALDPKYKKAQKNQTEKARTLMEARARKLFIDTIARKIDSSAGQDRKKGLKMLKKITNRFIDVYESGGSDGLPGLQIYTLLMNSTETQHDILVNLHRIMSTYNGYPLELELLITLGSIHPWLVKTSLCANKFFSEEELAEIETYKYDLKRGSKVKFVLNLVYRVVKDEKVLIFCHNIAPVRLFTELFERVFGWQKGREVLVLTGDLELFDRGRVMDKFEEPGNPSRVLLASITACAEGISLTAASRVIMLDSEWNPSKTKQAIARAFRPGQQKVVYVYQLLATGTLEEDKYRRTTWKEWVSSMIFSEDFVEDPSKWQAEKIEDDVLREMVAEDKTKSFHMIMKNEKASTVIRSDKK